MTEMRYGLDITSAGEWGRPDQIAELAALAEDHGWDGVVACGGLASTSPPAARRRALGDPQSLVPRDARQTHHRRRSPLRRSAGARCGRVGVSKSPSHR